MDQKIYDELSEKYADRMLDICYRAEAENDHITGGTIHDLAETICDCIKESFGRGVASAGSRNDEVPVDYE